MAPDQNTTTKTVAHWIALKRYRIAVFLHACRVPIRWGDKSLGSGDLRRANIRMMMERWDAKEPKPEDFDLPPGTARSKHEEINDG